MNDNENVVNKERFNMYGNTI